MGALGGFILGYYLGVKQGPEGHAELRRAFEAVLGSPEVKALLERLPMTGARAAASAGNGVGDADDGRPGDSLQIEHLAAIFRGVVESDLVQALVSGSIDLAKGFIERSAPARS